MNSWNMPAWRYGWPWKPARKLCKRRIITDSQHYPNLLLQHSYTAVANSVTRSVEANLAEPGVVAFIVASDTGSGGQRLPYTVIRPYNLLRSIPRVPLKSLCEKTDSNIPIAGSTMSNFLEPAEAEPRSPSAQANSVRLRLREISNAWLCSVPRFRLCEQRASR